ncbi:putative iron-regulated membrane protein [Endobacter medicaginis]|uniref:Putative iron-regulated membrane protein n=2 Tax=Endobacter medicaginis TaxID=1181271 RepID=A0A839UZA0_9PROT|nr:PepSY-associated TM helix domain-containing protein [Endobacter medicaginis]MBB3175116.1 putative iron-regulated membrane protein [Endobacter medicaginis]MCX5476431.1 PepSY-associated TM helix domain-containing protein [Endobacter medicaginis]
MKIRVRSDILHLYRELHSWVGILAGLFLFVAFYAGAISMFEQPLQDWATRPPVLPAPVSLSRTPELIERALAAHPEAAAGYSVILTPAGAHPARLEWSDGGGRHHHGRGGATVFAALDDHGALVTARQPASTAAGFIDVLHQQIGLPLPHDIAMPIMGVIALLYATALTSGTLVFLPTLARNLFSLKLFGSAQKAWLDLHNLLGIFSLPFHIVMAVTSVVFAFHEQVFVVQHLTLSTPPAMHRPHPAAGAPPVAALPPDAILAAIARQAPGVAVDSIDYLQSGRAMRISVHDPRYSLRGPTSGFATVDPSTGRILSRDYLPGQQPRGMSVITVFFALHFGSFGGTPVRVLYLLLGLGGAALFYGGNRLWVVARRRREQRDGRVRDSLGTRLLDRLTPGWSFGCVGGCSAVLCAAPLVADNGSGSVFAALFYGVFTAAVALAFVVPQRLSEQAPLWLASVLTLAVAPIAVLARPVSSGALLLAGAALLLGAGLAALARRSGRREVPLTSRHRPRPVQAA